MRVYEIEAVIYEAQHVTLRVEAESESAARQWIIDQPNALDQVEECVDVGDKAWSRDEVVSITDLGTDATNGCEDCTAEAPCIEHLNDDEEG